MKVYNLGNDYAYQLNQKNEERKAEAEAVATVETPSSVKKTTKQNKNASNKVQAGGPEPVSNSAGIEDYPTVRPTETKEAEKAEAVTA